MNLFVGLATAVALGVTLLNAGVFGSLVLLCAGLVALTLCRFALMHSTGRLPLFVTNFGFVMDYLDRLTDRQKLQQLFAQKPVSTSRNFDPQTILNALKAEIIGQDEAIVDVVRQVRGGFAQEKRSGPVGVFMFAGPPATGKTEFGRVLGRTLFGEGGYYEVAMESYSQPGSASTLFGASSGHVGSDAMAPLMAHLASNPATVIVLNEFEKAHDSVRKSFLSGWEEGFITEMTRGRPISTTQAIFVATTNAAQDEIAAAASTHVGDRRALSDQCKRLLSRAFADSVLSRIDYVFPLMPLKNEELAHLLLKMAYQHVDKYGMALRHVTAETLFNYVEDSVRRGVDAREMRRKIAADITDSVLDLKESGVQEVTISERGGQVFVHKFIVPKPPTKSAKPKDS